MLETRPVTEAQKALLHIASSQLIGEEPKTVPGKPSHLRGDAVVRKATTASTGGVDSHIPPTRRGGTGAVVTTIAPVIREGSLMRPQRETPGRQGGPGSNAAGRGGEYGARRSLKQLYIITVSVRLSSCWIGIANTRWPDRTARPARPQPDTARSAPDPGRDAASLGRKPDPENNLPFDLRLVARHTGTPRRYEVATYHRCLGRSQRRGVRRLG